MTAMPAAAADQSQMTHVTYTDSTNQTRGCDVHYELQYDVSAPNEIDLFFWIQGNPFGDDPSCRDSRLDISTTYHLADGGAQVSSDAYEQLGFEEAASYYNAKPAINVTYDVFFPDCLSNCDQQFSLTQPK
jgi:hypothetical protein